MAAANGTITFEFPNRTRATYSIYLDDTAGNPVRFSKDGKAGTVSPDFLNVPMVGIADITIASATGQSTTVIKRNDMAMSTILNANYLASVVNRPFLGLVVPGGKLTMIQVA